MIIWINWRTKEVLTNEQYIKLEAEVRKTVDTMEAFAEWANECYTAFELLYRRDDTTYFDDIMEDWETHVKSVIAMEILMRGWEMKSI